MSNAAKLNWDKKLRTSLRLNKRPYRKAQSFNYYAPMVGWKDPSKQDFGKAIHAKLREKRQAAQAALNLTAA